MATEIAVEPTSQAQAVEKTVKSDGKKSDNVKDGQVAQALLKRASAIAAGKSSSETIAEAAKAAEIIAPQSEPTLEKSASETAPAKEEKSDKAKADEALSKSTQAEPDITPEMQKILDKRIGKYAAEQKKMEAQIEQLQERLKTVPVVPPPAAIPPTPDNPLANLNDVAALQNELRTAKETRRWAQEQLDRDDLGNGVEVVIDGKSTTYTKQQLKAIVRNVERTIEDHIPQRASFLQQRDQNNAKAVELFDFLKEPDSKEYRAYQQFMADPDIARRPNGAIVAGLLVEGDRSIQRAIAERSGGTKTVKEAARRTAPSSQTAMGAAPGAIREPSGTTAQRELAHSLEGLKKSGKVTVKDVGRYLAEKLNHR